VKGKSFFFEKKKQKTFFYWAVLVSAPQAQTNKSFCAAFFKRRPLARKLLTAGKQSANRPV
jgi:hypothetical protein